MSHNHIVTDADARFSINPITRAIKNESPRKTLLIQGDHGSERFTFEIPRYIEGHDMSVCNLVSVHYINADSSGKNYRSGVYTVDDLHIAPDDENTVVCSWLISHNATGIAGRLNFLIKYKCVVGNETTYVWNTAVYSEIAVLSGINADESFETEYVDVIEQWKMDATREITDAVNANVTEWKETESGVVRGIMNEYSEQWNAALAVERARIDGFVALGDGSTTGDAELMDIRIGADNVVYHSAGTSVRTQFAKLNTFVDSCMQTGMAEYKNMYAERETNVGTDECTTQGATPSQAYGNGYVFENDAQIVGFKMNDAITATSFGVFVFNADGEKIHETGNIEPDIANGEFRLDKPIDVPTGGCVLIRFLNGVFCYQNVGNAVLKEYQPGTGKMIASPIKIGIEYIYNDVYRVAAFKNETVYSEIDVSDYLMPKYIANANDEYTFIGRWYDHTVDGKTYKSTNAAGSGIAFKIENATKLNIGFHAITAPEYTPYFAYSIDGNEFVRQKITDSTIPLPDASEHWVWVVIDGMGENDPIAGGKWYGKIGVYFTGVTTDGTVCGADASNKQIMFIGDSIVEGINVLGDGANADTNSAVNGFAFKTARALNSIPLLCGYGGTAVLGNSSFHKPIEAIDYNMNGIPVNVQKPDIVCIEHGYNDGTIVSNGTYTSDDFKNGYNALIDRIKTKYPGVQIICIIPFKQSLKREIIECTEGRPYCHVIDTADWNVTYTDNAHPNKSGAITASEKLAQNIIKLFGKQYFMN